MTTWSVCLPTCFVAYLFIFTGLAVTVISLLLYPLKLVNRNLYRLFVMYLAEHHWGVMVCATLHLWRCRVLHYTPSGQDPKIYSANHCVAVMNHYYDVDFMSGWIGADRFNCLGGCKVLVKESTKHLPVFGWIFRLNEMIFLTRDWKQDETILKRDLKHYRDLPRPCWLLLCPEGTRFTAAKRAKSLAFCQSRGLPELKHHLLPRTKGFNVIIKELRGTFSHIIDFQIAFEPNPDGSYPTASSTSFSGIPWKSHCLAKFIDINEVPEDEELSTQWLYKLFQEKDEAMDYFLAHNSFLGYKDYQLCQEEHPRRCLLATIFWICLSLPPLIYLVGHLIFASSWLVFFIVNACIGICFISIKILITATETKKVD